ncbi:MAG: hypothetical protein H6R19_204 [Proteobacteria bacterium]|nr:hypothetical protein [Pseudomonadota bacterium]
MKLSLRAKLTGAILVLVALVTLSISIGSYFQMRNQLINIAISNEVDAVDAGVSELIQQWVGIRTGLVTAGVQAIEAAESPLPAIVQTAKAGNFQAAYLGTPDKQMITDHDMQLPPGYDPTSRPWYKDSVGASGTRMTEPYVDMSTKKLVISFVAPVHKAGNLFGVMGTDVLLDDIVKSVLDIQLVGGGYGVLISQDGKVLVHRDNALITKPATEIAPQFDVAALESIAKADHLTEQEIGGATKYVHVHAIDGTNMYLMLVVDKATALAPLTHLLWQGLIILLVGMALVIPLASLLLSRMLSSIRHIHDTMVDIANGGGDLTHKIEIDGNDEIAETAQAFNRFLDQLRAMFGRIRSESEQLAAGLDTISGEVADLSDSSQNLTELTTQNAAAIEEITVSISHIADNSHDADTLVKGTDALSLESAKTVRNVSDEAARSASEVEALSALLDRLGKRTDEISGIIEVIKDIADQTNLLALNAAIEAARAGETGRGFAVVADEVRKLAERTRKATVQITDMIAAVHTETQGAVGTMHNTLVAVRSGADHSLDAAEKITSIRQNMSGVVTKMEEIALSTREQLAATTAMAQAAEKITSQTLHSDAALQRAANEVHALSRMALDLRAQFANFRI